MIPSSETAWRQVDVHPGLATRAAAVGSPQSAQVRPAGAILGVLLVTGGLMASDWTRFRGPNGTGVAEGRELPVDFGPATGVLWQADVPA